MKRNVTILISILSLFACFSLSAFAQDKPPTQPDKQATITLTEQQQAAYKNLNAAFQAEQAEVKAAQAALEARQARLAAIQAQFSQFLAEMKLEWSCKSCDLSPDGTALVKRPETAQQQPAKPPGAQKN